jgi:hydrogenase expression/formation protein HypE
MERVTLAHGSGGKMSHDLIARLIQKNFDNPVLSRFDDSAVVSVDGDKLAFTTDSYVISPIFFPGGDIGKLSVCGTVNDLAMSGAEPRYLTLSLIIEEGLPMADLERIILSIKNTTDEAGIVIAGGDTKVVNKGSCDRIFINTSGIGTIRSELEISGSNAAVGDVVIVSGSIGDHGMAIMTSRGEFEFQSEILSDCAPLNGLVNDMIGVSTDIRVLRDPTRGGLATTLNEIASSSDVGIEIEESKILVRPDVRAACEMLGLDPLYVANEGKLIAVVPQDSVEKILESMRGHRYGKEACVIGCVVEHTRPELPMRVTVKTSIGGSRILDMLTGEQLPRIC